MPDWESAPDNVKAKIPWFVKCGLTDVPVRDNPGRPTHLAPETKASALDREIMASQRREGDEYRAGVAASFQKKPSQRPRKMKLTRSKGDE